MKKKLLFLTAGIAVVLCFQYCNNSTGSSSATETTAAPSGINPVALPDPHISGFHFPEDSNTINQWVGKNDTASIAAHGWGIWTALNMSSGQSIDGQDLRVFETWYTPDDITAAIIAKKQNKQFTAAARTGRRGMLKTPHQFIHAREMKNGQHGLSVSPEDSSRILGFVKYDPAAAEFTINNKLYDSSTLQGMMRNGNAGIPDFPNDAITTKPVFKIISRSSLANGYYQLKVWTGPPAQPQGYPEQQWPACVYVDLNNKGSGNGSVDTGCKGRTPQTTYNVNDFVHFSLDKETAENLKANFNLQVQEGDIAILVAMHVTSKEIKRWTWQTYWWAPNPDAPPAPSSSFLASARPKELTGPARHYAMSIAYTFINPNQPLTGGNNKGTSLYVFNPYLEAGFDETVFYEPAQVITNGQVVVNNVGVRTNCMSCHALANFNPNNAVPTGPGYIADTYIDMDGARFKGVLKVDFLWSIQGNVINDSTSLSFKTNQVRPLNRTRR